MRLFAFSEKLKFKDTSGWNMPTHNERVASYYDYTTPFYRFFWHGKTGSIHYGFADRTTISLNDELMNTNKFLAEKAEISKGDHILDAGCGVGGSSVWLREHFDVHVNGITLSQKQLETARKTVHQKDLTNITFSIRDFLNTGFDDESFDTVWALESVCYAKKKRDFMSESFRILRPGGRLIVADGFLLRNPASEQEKEWLNQFLHGLVLPNLSTTQQFKTDMEKEGFTNVTFWNKTKNTLPSSKRLYQMCKIGYPLSRITEKIGITPSLLTANNLAGIAQYRMVVNGLAGYGVFLGVKP